MIHFTRRFLFVVIALFSILKAEAQSIGGIASGSKSYCGSVNSGFVSVTGQVGTILNWVSSTNGGVTWTNIGNPTASQSYNNLTQTTCYRAVVKNGAFPTDTSTMACISIYTPSVGGTVSGGGTFCGGSGPGTLNLTGNTGNVLSWQYSTNGGASWTTIANTTITLNYLNITQNTLYWAIVQNGACPKDTSSQASFIVSPPTVKGSISSSDTVCYKTNNGTLKLTGSVGTVLKWLYSTDSTTWLPIGNTTTTQVYNGLTQTTWYKAIVKSGTCPPDTANNVKIKVLPLNPVSAGKDTSIVQGQSLTLNGSGVGTPLWSPSTGLNNVNILKPVALPVNTINYILTVTDANSCVNSDTVLITVILEQFDGMISNLFTPNNDGINDTWYIQGIQNYPDNQVFVYNIYGNEVYSKKNYSNDWQGTYNGSPLPDGTYYYVIRFEKFDKVMKGSLDILKSK